MNKTSVLSIALAAVALFAFRAAGPENFTADTAASSLDWTGYKVTGKHTGHVNLKNGSLQIEGGVLKGGSFDIDMTSITCTDLEGEWAGKLIGHLKSDDFFGVAANPTAKFVITRAIPQDTKGNYKVVGDLTIKGTTVSQKMFVNVALSGNSATATGKITIDRSNYNIKYGSGSFFDGLGDKTIYDEFDVAFTLVAKK